MNEELKEAKEESTGLGGERNQIRGHGKFKSHTGSLLTGDRLPAGMEWAAARDVALP